jgi:uncharacterized membrane protein YcaP (DUF421 family)
VWTLALPWYELVARATLVYVLFLAALRLSGKRELGQFTIFDLTFLLLSANALQPAITGPDASIPGAVVIVVTFFVLNQLVSMARRRSPLLRRLLDYSPAPIARNGKWIQGAIDHEGLDVDDLDAALREHGLESVDEVRLATLEHDGSISVVPQRGDRVQLHTKRRRYRRRGPESR